MIYIPASQVSAFAGRHELECISGDYSSEERCLYGITMEPKVVRAVEKFYNKRLITQVGVRRFFVVGEKNTGYETCPLKENVYCISGFMDAIIWNKCIFEIKSRCYKFMKPQYDLDQLITYMILFTFPLPGKLVQYFDGTVKISKEIPYGEAEEIWINEIKPKLDERILGLS